MLMGSYRAPHIERIIYGAPFAAALADEVALVGATAVYVLASGTLARETDTVAQLRAALGPRLAGVFTAIGPHTPRKDVVAAANAACAAGADLLVTVGGGSVTDAAKMVALCVANDVRDPSQLDAYVGRVGTDGRLARPPLAAPRLRSVAIPTTLSAGEFTATAGCTDTVRHVKQDFGHPFMVPRTIILDPAITVHTPEWLFLSTGIRAVDHAVEDICAINSQPLADAASLHALRLLGPGLRAVKANAADLAARLDCQIGAWLSVIGLQAGVDKGASHGIGHVLGGTAGVPHGYTSCIMLPTVLRFNHPVNAVRQDWVSEALGGAPGMDAADVVAGLVATLGLPGRLRDVAVAPEQLDRIATDAMNDAWVHTNPRRLEGPADVRKLLDAAW